MTPLYGRQTDAADLQRVYRVKLRPPAETPSLGPELIALFDKSIVRRQTKLSKMIEIWLQLVPETLSDHCSMLSLIRGTLTVAVDSGSHLYELKQLLLAGLQQQLLLAGRSDGLRKIVLRAGVSSMDGRQIKDADSRRSREPWKKKTTAR